MKLTNFPRPLSKIVKAVNDCWEKRHSAQLLAVQEFQGCFESFILLEGTSTPALVSKHNKLIDGWNCFFGLLLIPSLEMNKFSFLSHPTPPQSSTTNSDLQSWLIGPMSDIPPMLLQNINI